MGHYDFFNRQAWRHETLEKLEYYESEYQKLKEMTSLLELALWKAKMDDSRLDHGETTGGGNKKMKIDQSDFRLHCRINCGANHVVENVLPYLLPLDFMDNVDEELDDNSNDDEEEEEVYENNDNYEEYVNEEFDDDLWRTICGTVQNEEDPSQTYVHCGTD